VESLKQGRLNWRPEPFPCRRRLRI
jgi:hypothetical protein